MPVRFPLAISIGTDICHVPRIARIITRRDEGGIEKFAGKIFNHFERPIFTTRLQRYRTARDAARSAPGASNRTASDAELAALNAFARWVAGRFAAKEAAIKAVTRRLHYRDVTVLVPTDGAGPRRKPYALIEPAARSVRLSGAVARQRGVAVEEGAAFVVRPKLLRWKERAVARLSISHDGEYATATVLAAEEEEEDAEKEGKEEEEVLVDDGKGKPMHVPRLEDDFARMYNVQLNEFVKGGQLARLRELEGAGRLGRADAELLDRLRVLKAEMVARGLRTELDDKWSEGAEEVEGV